MDSKSVRRVCDNLGAVSRYNSKARMWTIEGKSKTHEISSADISSMPSRTLRAIILDQPVGTKDVPPVSSAKEIESAKTLLGIKAPAKTAKKSATTTKRASAKSSGDKLTTFAIDSVTPQKPARVNDARKDMLWLTQFGVHKWALRQKAKKHGASKELQALLARPTKWYSKSDMREVVKAIFDDTDKLIIKHRDDYTKRVVKIAETSRSIAEKIIEKM